jgi:AcrR family transcriptional regulator
MSPRRAAALRDGEQSLREHLIATAEQLIAEHRTAGLTVRAIARAAGVADGVLYNHFADKEELLANALHAHIRTVERTLPTLPRPGVGSVADNLEIQLHYGLALHKAILPAFAGLLGQPAVLARYAELAEHGPVWREELLSYLRAEQDAGRLAATADVVTAAALLVGVCHEQVLTALLPTTAAAAPPTADSVITTLLDGIRR